MLNLIPALILLLVNGPAAPLSDNALLGTSVSVQRQADPDAQAALLRLAFSRLAVRDDSARPTGAPDEDGEREPVLLDFQAQTELQDGFLTPGRTRDGPA